MAIKNEVIDRDLVLKYKELKEKFDESSAEIQKQRALFEDSIADIKRKNAEIFDELSILKEKISTVVMAYYLESKKKQAGFGFGIREYIKVNYKESDALDWAKIHMPYAIETKVNTKVLENFLKKTPQDFASITTTPTVIFPQSIDIENENTEENI